MHRYQAYKNVHIYFILFSSGQQDELSLVVTRDTLDMANELDRVDLIVCVVSVVVSGQG